MQTLTADRLLTIESRRSITRKQAAENRRYPCHSVKTTNFPEPTHLTQEVQHLIQEVQQDV